MTGGALGAASGVFFFLDPYAPVGSASPRLRRTSAARNPRHWLLRAISMLDIGFILLAIAFSDPCGRWSRMPCCWPDRWPAGRAARKRAAGGTSGNSLEFSPCREPPDPSDPPPDGLQPDAPS